MDFIKGNEQVKIDPNGIDISGTSNILLNSDGKVGIGTNNPQYPLQVNGSHSIFSNTPELLLFKEFGPGRLGPTLDWGNTEHTDWKIKADTTGLNILSGANGATTESITINNTGTIDISGDMTINGDFEISGNKFVVTDTGNVGIGTTTPTSKLDVNGKISTQDSLEIGPITDMYKGLTVTKDDVKMVIGNYGGAYNLPSIQVFSNLASNETPISSSNTYHMLIQPNGGNVGIGTNSASEQLEVNGNIKANGIKIPVTLFGNVNSAGGIEDSGSGGWSSTRSGTGKYTVTFTTQFSSRPAAIITQVYPDFGTATHGVGNLKDGFLVNGIDTGKFYCSTGDGNGSLSDRNFSFMVMGYI